MPSILLCQGCLTNQQGDQFSLWQGLTPEHQRAVVEAAQNDPLIVRQTSDATRFATLEKMNSWLTSRPTLLYALTPQNSPKKLSGLVWFIKKPLSSSLPESLSTKVAADWTFGIRLYQTARGQRLSTPLMKLALEFFWQTHPNQPVWLSTGLDNTIAQKIYEQFGWQLIGETTEKRYYLLESPTI